MTNTCCGGSALSLVTLWLIITIVFVIVNILPNDIGRQLSGPFAPQEQVDALNEELGTNDPLIEQYGRLLKSTITFDFGESFAQNKPVSEVVGRGLRPLVEARRATRSSSRSR